MSGFAKEHYKRFIFETKRQLKEYVKKIEPILPYNYDISDIVSAIKKYYPFEWRIIVERYHEYTRADKKNKKLGKKARYKMPSPEELLLSLPATKQLVSLDYMEMHRDNYYHDERIQSAKDFLSERELKISKREKRINKALARTQRVEPEFLDQLMGLYDRKNVKQKDKVYLMKELEKYYCPKIVNFFKKVAHSEINFQLREEAVHHLLSLGHFAELRKQKYMSVHIKNRDRRRQLLREYAKERFSIDAIPEELEYRISNSKEQGIKTYDYFISHSSEDHDDVQRIIYFLNKNGINVYCDWISDSDYLKRHLVCNATLKVIEKRLQQSKAVLFIASRNSYGSQWVKYELNYFHNLGRKIYCIELLDIHKEGLSLEFQELKDMWYVDSEYQKNVLYQ